jgi:putative ABC transport system permease protein
VERGGVVVAVPGLSKLSSLTMVTGTFVLDQNTYAPTQVEEKGRSALPVVAVPSSFLGSGAMPDQTGALVTPQTAERLGWPVQQQAVLLHAADGGAIDKATQTQLDERLGDQGGLYVERGFQRYDETVMRVMFAIAAFLILVVTLISTALSMAEQQSDMGTFAAVGATRRTRRALAASQAMTVGFIGAVLGVVVGLVPGVAISYPLTAESGFFDSVTGRESAPAHYLEIPWQPLALVVVGVPILAGLLSAAAIRKAPTMTRRAD